MAYQLQNLNRSEILSYLNQVFDIEKEYYEISTLISTLNQKINILNTQLNEASKKCEETKNLIDEKKITLTSTLIDFIGTFLISSFFIFFGVYIAVFLLSMVVNLGDVLVGIFTNFKTNYFAQSFPIALFLTFPISFVVTAMEITSTNKWEREKLIKNTNIYNETANFINYNTPILNEYLNSLSILKEHEQQLQQLRIKIYSYPFLHQKYQNFVSVASLLTYLETGQCESLYGRDGAYRMFEEDLLQKHIILRLDNIIAQLEEIKDMQHKIYSALKECNNKVNGIIREIESINSTLKENISIQNYYAEKSYREQKFQSDLLFWNSFA